MIKNVIFDLDGTLADSAILTTAAFEEIAPIYNLPVPEVAAVRAVTGYANPEFYYRLFPNVSKEVVDKIGEDIECKELLIADKFKNELFFPGCKELLLALLERDIKIYIASTGDERHVERVLEVADVTTLFTSINYGEPDKADMLRRIITEPKSEWLMVGDMRKDVEGSKANGIICVGACYGYCIQGRDAFDHYIYHPMELLKIVGG